MNAPTRRALLVGTSCALAAATAGMPSAAAAPAPDADLLAAASEFLTLHSEYLLRLRPVIRSADDAAGDAAYAFCDAEIWPREDSLINLITSLPARTPPGLHAKASVLQAWLHRRVPESLDGTFEEEAECHEHLAMSLVNDVLMAGGAS